MRPKDWHRGLSPDSLAVLQSAMAASSELVSSDPLKDYRLWAASQGAAIQAEKVLFQAKKTCRDLDMGADDSDAEAEIT